MKLHFLIITYTRDLCKTILHKNFLKKTQLFFYWTDLNHSTLFTTDGSFEIYSNPLVSALFTNNGALIIQGKTTVHC